MRADEKGYDPTLVFQNELAHATAPDTGALIVRNDSPITSVKQLAGKKIAHSGIGTQAWAAVVDVEMKNGVDPHALQDLEMGYRQMPGVLQQGLVDAVAVVDPFTSAIVAAKQGHVISWFYVDSVLNQPVGAFRSSRAWVAKNRDTVRRYRAAMHGALTYMNQHPDEAKRFIAEYTGLKPETVAAMNPIRWDDRVSAVAEGVNAAPRPTPSIATAPALIAMRGVRKAYRFHEESVEAIAGIDLDVPVGSFVSIIGPSGSRKSTLLQIVAGLLEANAGDVRFHGRSVTGPSPGMIYVFQEYEKSIFPWRTVAQNVALGIEDRRDLSATERRERCGRYLQLVGLHGVADRFPAQLSGGM